MDQEIRNLERLFSLELNLELADQLCNAYSRARISPDPDILSQLIDVYRENQDVETIFGLVETIPEAGRKSFLETYARKTGIWYGLLKIDPEELKYWNAILAEKTDEENNLNDEALETYTYGFDKHYEVDIKVVGGETRSTSQIYASYIDAPFFLDGQEISVADPGYELDGDYFYSDDEEGLQFHLRIK